MQSLLTFTVLHEYIIGEAGSETLSGQRPPRSEDGTSCRPYQGRIIVGTHVLSIKQA